MAVERKIGGVVYKCEKLPAEQAIGLFMRLTKFFRESPEMMTSIAFGDGSDRAAFIAVGLGGAVSPEEGLEMVKELVGICSTGGDPCILGHKPQSMEDAISVAWFAMEVQFRDFLLASLPAPRAGQPAGADAE